jgi:AcrR family transcriptional regulator
VLLLAAMSRTLADARRTKGDATREAIVRKALEMAAEVGLEQISLGVLATSLDLSKSGLFAHFKSKEALQLAIFDEAVERFSQQVVVPALAAPRGEPRVRALFTRRLDWIEDSGFGKGCFFEALTYEFDDRPGAIRDRLVQSQRDLHSVFAKAVRLAVSERHFVPSVDADQFAFEVDGISAAFHRAYKLFGDRQARDRSLRAFERLVADARVSKKG